MAETSPTVSVLNVPVYVGNLPAAVAEMAAIAADPTNPRANRRVSFCDARVLVTATEEPDYQAILQSCYRNMPDGMPLVWVGRRKGAQQMQRCMGPEFMAQFLRATAQLPIKHYLAGGNPGVAERLRDAIQAKFGNTQVVGTYCPPFRALTPDEWQALAADIRKTGADVVWVGISSPKQERFAAELAKHVQVHFYFTVGAAFDYHTDSIQRAPDWMANNGLEWVFRLIQEPKRLWRRYLHVVPRFIWLNARDLYGPAR